MSQTLTTKSPPTVLLTTYFARDTLCVLDAAGAHEVTRLGSSTPVHHAPEEGLGIVNLRGKIATIVDLGLRLGFPKIATEIDTRVDEVVEEIVRCGRNPDRGWK